MTFRSPLTRTIGFAILAVFMLLIVMLLLRTWDGKHTVMLTWPPLWECVVTFFAGVAAAAFMIAALARPLAELSLRHALGIIAVPVFGGAIAVAALCWCVEAMTFSGRPIAIEQGEFIVVRADISTKGFNSGKATLSVVRDEQSGGGVAVPVPREFFDRLGGFRYNENAAPVDRQCLTLHFQRSGDMVRVVLLTPDGGEYPPELHECGAGFTEPS